MSNQIQSLISSDPVILQQEQQEDPNIASVNESSSQSSLVEQVQQPKPVSIAAVVQPTVISTPIQTASPKKVVAVNDYPEVTGIPDADRVLKNVPAAHQTGIQRLLEYCVKMNPSKPIEIQEGVKAQVALFRIIQNTINREDTYFRQLFAAILTLFAYEKTGVFKEENVFRFMDSITLNDVERKAFTRLINLVKLLGPKESRAVALKQVNFTSSLQYGLTDEGRQRVLGFFNVTK